MENGQKNLIIRVWIGLLGFLAVGGLWGGVVLMIDPSGSIVQFPASFLEKIPFPNFFIPGLCLLILNGIIPAIAVYGLVKKPDWQWARRINVYKDQFWAWTFALYSSIILIVWMDLQVIILGYEHFIQAFYSLFGVLLLTITLLPPVKNYYRK